MIADAEFFTGQSVGTFAGASLAVLVLTNTFRLTVKRDWILVPLVISLGVSALAAPATGGVGMPAGLVFVFLNGCLLFCTAAGAQETLVVVAKPTPEDKIKRHGVQRTKLVQSWLRAS